MKGKLYMDRTLDLLLLYGIGGGGLIFAFGVLVLGKVKRTTFLPERRAIERILYRDMLFGILALILPLLILDILSSLFSSPFSPKVIPCSLIIICILGMICYIGNGRDLAMYAGGMNRSLFPSPEVLTCFNVIPLTSFFWIYQGLYALIISMVGNTYSALIALGLVVFVMITLAIVSAYLLLLKRRVERGP